MPLPAYLHTARLLLVAFSRHLIASGLHYSSAGLSTGCLVSVSCFLLPAFLHAASVVPNYTLPTSLRLDKWRPTQPDSIAQYYLC